MPPVSHLEGRSFVPEEILQKSFCQWSWSGTGSFVFDQMDRRWWQRRWMCWTTRRRGGKAEKGEHPFKDNQYFQEAVEKKNFFLNQNVRSLLLQAKSFLPLQLLWCLHQRLGWCQLCFKTSKRSSPSGCWNRWHHLKRRKRRRQQPRRRQKQNQQPRRRPKQKKKIKQDIAEESAEEKKAPALKSSFKHRKTSAAYHKARADAIKAGLSPNSVKEKARSALRQMAADIDSGLVKEEWEKGALHCFLTCKSLALLLVRVWEWEKLLGTTVWEFFYWWEESCLWKLFGWHLFLIFCFSFTNLCDFHSHWAFFKVQTTLHEVTSSKSQP